jgi:hypothetical protein
MSEQPDRLETLLRDAMRARVEGAFPAPGAARRALRGAQRGRRVQYAATAAASVAAVGVATATATGLHTAPGRGGTAATLGGGLPSPTGSCFDTASPIPAVSSAVTSSGPAGSISTYTVDTSPNSAGLTTAAGQSLDQPVQQGPSAQIRAVTLADPAPEYPLRRGSDSLTPTGFGPLTTYWTATSLLAQTPGAQHSIGGGGVETDPTGPEATVLVIDGHPFNLDNPTTIEGLPVSETTTVLGRQAWVTSACDQTDIVFSTGRFQVLLAAFPGGDDTVRDANVARLKAVAASIQGLQ